MDLPELIARESIRDLVARYNANGDVGRIDALMELFHEDAVVEVVPHRTYRGREQIRSLFEGAAGEAQEPTVRVLRHFTATHQIDVRSDCEASGRCYFVVLTDQGVDHWGRYIDEYVMAEDGWRFLRRRVEVDGRVPGGWGERTSERLHGG